MTNSELIAAIKSSLSQVISDAAPAAQERITQVATRIAEDQRFHSFDILLMKEEFAKIVVRLYDVAPGNPSENIEIGRLYKRMQTSKNLMEDAVKNAGAQPIHSTPEIIAREAAFNARVDPRRGGGGLSKALNEIQIDKGTGLLFSGMFAVGALASAASIVSKDEATGERKIHITSLMLTLAQGLLAGGIAYLSFRQPLGAQRMPR